MYPRNFLCEEAKIKQRTSLKKESRFTPFFGNQSLFLFLNLYVEKNSREGCGL